jgi:AcrR family transcriptional regulator
MLTKRQIVVKINIQNLFAIVKYESRCHVVNTTERTEMSTKGNRIDPRVRRTRQLLRQALMDLIPKKGYNAITVQDITDRATLNRATFYLHYRDKDDLLYKGMLEVLDELTTSNPLLVAEAGKLSVEETWKTIERELIHVANNLSFYQAMLGENGVWGFAHMLHDYIYENTEQRLISIFGDLPKGPVPIEIVLAYIAFAYVGIIQWWVEEDMPYSVEEMADNLVKLYALGIYKAIGLEADINGMRRD